MYMCVCIYIYIHTYYNMYVFLMYFDMRSLLGWLRLGPGWLRTAQTKVK